MPLLCLIEAKTLATDLSNAGIIETSQIYAVYIQNANNTQ